MRIARVIAFGFAAVGCAPQASAPAATHPSTCPACECKCECETAPGGGGESYERDELLAAAVRKAGQGDGPGCLDDLERAKTLDPRPRFDAENPESPHAHTRAQCLMLAGQCDAGKAHARAALEQNVIARWGPEHIERVIDAHTSMYCRGKMSDRDAVLQSLMELQRGAYMTKEDVAFCDRHYERIKRLRGRVRPRNEDDRQIIDLDRSLMSMAPVCYQRAGDCKRAWVVFRETAAVALPDVYGPRAGSRREETLRASFDAVVSKCKGSI